MSLGGFIFTLFILALLIPDVVFNTWTIQKFWAKSKGPFTRPEAPTNLSSLDHVHMRSGTIYEVRNPETEGILPVQTELSRSSTDPTTQWNLSRVQESFWADGRSLAEVSNSIHEVIVPNQAAPGVIVTHTIEGKHTGQEMSLPEVKRKSRYQRDPVI